MRERKRRTFIRGWGRVGCGAEERRVSFVFGRHDDRREAKGTGSGVRG
jgi:hypothetical protein